MSEKVKKQIWGNEDVDFAVIFHHSSNSEDHYTFKVQNGQGGGQPTLSLVASVKKQPVHTIDQWTAAFQAFVAVYCERFPSETAQLMKYGAIVRDLAQRGANWKFYDESFRMLHQSELIPWDQIHSELWLRASVPKVKQPLPAKSTTKPSGSFFPRGFCWTFLRGATAQGVNSNTSVLNAALITPFPTASKTRNEQDSGQFQNQGCQPATAQPTRLPTPVKVNRLAFYLTCFADQFRKNLIDGFTFGFRLHFQGPSKASGAKNVISAMQRPEVVYSKLIKERQCGRILGPFSYPPFSNLRVSSLGVIPKKDPGEFRMIHHLSFSYGDSINTFIPSEFSTVKYATVDDAINFTNS